MSSPSELSNETVPKVAIVYHFFASYRKPVLESLDSFDGLDMLFVADKINRLTPGLETWAPATAENFKVARNYPLFGGFMIQAGVIGLAFKRDLDCIIYLGDWKWPATWCSAILARLTGKRVLFWTHGWLKPEKGFKGWLRKTFYSIADGLLLYGNRAKQIGLEKGFDADRMYVVYNSLDYRLHSKLESGYSIEKAQAIRNELFVDPTFPVIICSTRLHASKRMSELLRAMDLLNQQGHRVNLILIGDGDDKGNLEKLAIDLGLDVHFEGACFDDHRVAELTMAATLTVSPGPIGLTAIQSMTFGVPAISNDDLGTQGPEAEAIVPGVTGDLFENGCLDDLAAKIKHWTSTIFVEDGVRQSCKKIIEEKFNPDYQVTVFSSAVKGQRPHE